MDAQIPERWVTHFMSRLTEDSVYYIKYFQVCNARPNYRPVDYPYMARFTAHTQIHQVNTIPAHFPEYAYKLSTTEELHQRRGITEYCSGHKYITIHLRSLHTYDASYIFTQVILPMQMPSVFSQDAPM